MIRLGIDVGSTTIKVVVVDEKNEILYKSYRRHFTRLIPTIVEILQDLKQQIGSFSFQLCFTGSGAMGMAEALSLQFVQEVVAVSRSLQTYYSDAHTLIDLGGEDTKLVLLEKGKNPDIRMNGNCAGGTGAFIDQMAGLLNLDIAQMNDLAEKYTTIYPIASRCGVFAKTDIQNLIARKIATADIAASIFHAVALQTINALARGCEIRKKVIFCGGPLTYIKSLRDAFVRLLKLQEGDYALPEDAQLFTALGAALLVKEDNVVLSIDDLVSQLNQYLGSLVLENKHLPALFSEEYSLAKWEEERNIVSLPEASLVAGKEISVCIGIDSGSTTTKVVIIDDEMNLLYSFYEHNQGNPLVTAIRGLQKFYDEVEDKNCKINVIGSAVTGYGEDLLHSALSMDYGIVETIAHYMAARQIDENVSFILDIGGQDIKAIFADNGTITNIEINEACSSGCGSFIEGFAKSLGFSAEKFSKLACKSQSPCDLGSRCTVFMNSKVRQAVKEGATIEDLSAGLAYSVVKNCLYKVLNLQHLKSIGDNIVVQGGTFKNKAVFRALELLSGKKVSCSSHPELMGAYGAALYARSKAKIIGKSSFIGFSALESAANHETRFSTCKGCTNNCSITVFKFPNGKRCFSGNKCEKVFSNNPETQRRGDNIFDYKRERLFASSNVKPIRPRMRIGIPRALSIFENFPFWQALFSNVDIEVVLSSVSSSKLYEKGAGSIMSDNICFPAKLSHGHVVDLIEKGVDRIFYPFVLFEQKEFKHSHNCYNCPIVTGYSEVLKNINTSVPFDAPAFNFNDKKLTTKACVEYLVSLGIKRAIALNAVKEAFEAQRRYKNDILTENNRIYLKARQSHTPVILLAGHPYHADLLVHQKISDILSDLGVAVINEEIAVDNESKAFCDEYFTISQWEYPNRILQAAAWVKNQDENVYMVQTNSFGCGPDAIIVDEIKELLKRNNCSHTLIRIDEIASTGSIKLRLRSLVESIRLKAQKSLNKPNLLFQTTTPFGLADKNKTILAPWFGDFYSPYISFLAEKCGYKIINLPKTSRETLDVALRVMNNEICYPALCVVGDLIAAVESGNYDLNNIALGITQTGGQCRATNYVASIKRALVNQGYTDIPVVTIAVSASAINEQPGFNFDVKKIIFSVLHILSFADALSRLYYATVSREIEKGTSNRLRDEFIERSLELLKAGKKSKLLSLLNQAVEAFNAVEVTSKPVKTVGIIGEIYVKYNSFGNYGIIDYLISQGVEVVVPPATNFFTQGFVNAEAKQEQFINPKSNFSLLSRMVEKFISSFSAKYEEPLKKFVRYRPVESVREEAKLASQSVNLLNQYGEGWLIPGEIAGFAHQGIKDIVCIQPFGCIANHVVGKGIEKKMKTQYPDINLLFLDFDYGTSEVNVHNRLQFLINE